LTIVRSLHVFHRFVELLVEQHVSVSRGAKLAVRLKAQQNDGKRAVNEQLSRTTSLKQGKTCSERNITLLATSYLITKTWKTRSERNVTTSSSAQTMENVQRATNHTFGDSKPHQTKTWRTCSERKRAASSFAQQLSQELQK
jgi:hypothetical protein